MMNRARTILILITIIITFLSNPGKSADLFVDDNFTPSEPGYGITHFTSISDALSISITNDVIHIHDGIYAEEVSLSHTVSLVAMPGEYPVMNGAGFINSTGITISASNVYIEGIIIRDYDNGIRITASGDASIYHCQIFDNLVYGILNENTTAGSDAMDCWWGAPSGPYDPSDDRESDGLFNPNGLGNQASDHINYYPWSVNTLFNQYPVEFGIYNPSCETLEVRFKPLSDIVSTATIMQFTVRWEAGTVNIMNVNSPVFNFALNNPVIVSGGYNYAVFTSNDFIAVNWAAGIEVPVLTFDHDGSGTDFGEFEIILDSWTLANNADPYIELMGTDFSGFIYHNAENVYLDDCNNPEMYARVYLEGPYDSVQNVMGTALHNNIPLNQPYQIPPWVYQGAENLASIPDEMVDWVLVELRSTPSGPSIDRSAGILMSNGRIMDATLDGYLRFNGISTSSPYYIVVHHRNHLPVMSLDPVFIPNPLLFDFSDTLNFPPYGTGKKAMSKLETGVYGLITGDVNNDGKLKYSGPMNDRGLIMNTIYYVTGSPVITQTITGYYKEDLTMDHVVKYSGPNNDQREIILNLVDLTGSTALTSTFQCVVPGYGTNAPENGGPIAAEITSELVDLGIFEYSAPDELVIKARPDHTIPGYGLTNIQFTLRWPETSNVYQLWPTANAINSAYNIQPQGPVTLADGYYHQIFAAANNTVLNWTSGTEYPVLVLEYFYTTGDCTAFEITNDTWTVENNGTYYLEVIGQNRTGILYEYLLQIVSEGGYVEGSQDICLGTSTGILLLMDHHGTVTRWQKRFNSGSWIDIPGTAGVTSYNETPGYVGIYEYRAEVQSFGCAPDFSEPAIIEVLRYATWSGNADSNWDDETNWNECGIPTLQMDVLIPNVNPNPYPYVTLNGFCKTITIKSGATVTVSPTGSVTVGENTVYTPNEKIPLIFIK